MSGVRRIDTAEAGHLIDTGDIVILDVRTPGEFTGLGHIPGALLLPVDLSICAAAVLPDDERPVLVCCEHGVRSAFAAELLARAVDREVLDLAGGMAVWRGPRVHEPAPITGPAGWLLECADLLPRSGRALDVACGRGRHALLLAAAGFTTRAVDRSEAAVAGLAGLARRLSLPVDADVLDLEQGEPDLGSADYDVVVVFNYLHRPLFPALRRALAPGGLLIYETFTREQATIGHPRNPHFLFETGELRALMAELTVEREREGRFDGRFVASIAARRA